MISQTAQSTRFGVYACVAAGFLWTLYSTQTEQWFTAVMVVVPLVLSLYALFCAKSKQHAVMLLCIAVVSVRVVDSMRYHYVMAESKIVHAERTDDLCKTDTQYAWTEADRGADNRCAEAIRTLALSRMQVALVSVGGLNGWIWLLTGLDFKTGFHTLAESHVGYLWAAGTCFAVVTLVGTFAMAVYGRMAVSSPAPRTCVPEHTNALYTPPLPQITYPRPNVFELPISVDSKLKKL